MAYNFTEIAAEQRHWLRETVAYGDFRGIEIEIKWHYHDLLEVLRGVECRLLDTDPLLTARYDPDMDTDDMLLL